VPTREQLAQIGRRIGVPSTAVVEAGVEAHADGGPALVFSDERWQRFVEADRTDADKRSARLHKSARSEPDRAATGSVLTEPWLHLDGDPKGPYRLYNWDGEQVAVGMRATFRSAWQLRDVHARPIVTLVRTGLSYRGRSSTWLIRGPHYDAVGAIADDTRTVERDGRKYKSRAVTRYGQPAGAYLVTPGVGRGTRRRARVEDERGDLAAILHFTKQHAPEALTVPDGSARTRLVVLAAMVIFNHNYGLEPGG
jgi:hypothetical protein